MCYFLARSYIFPRRSKAELPGGFADEIWSLPAERRVPVWIATPKSPASNKAVFILVHGYGGNRATWSDLAVSLSEAGHTCIIPAMPGHDASEESATSFGVGEATLLVEISNEVRQRNPGCRVIGVGLSMGGSALLLASCLQPNAFDGIASDSAFADFTLAICGYYDAQIKGGRFLLAPTTLFAARISGIDPRTVRPVEAAESWKGKPLVIIQGTSDRIMGLGHAEMLSKAANVDVTWFEGAGHADCYKTNPEKYLESLLHLAFRIEKANHEPPIQ